VVSRVNSVEEVNRIGPRPEQRFRVVGGSTGWSREIKMQEARYVEGSKMSRKCYIPLEQKERGRGGANKQPEKIYILSWSPSGRSRGQKRMETCAQTIEF